MRGISLDQAQSIINHALDLARQLQAPPLSICVLDSGGHTKCSVSEDDSGTLRLKIASGKANAAIGMGFDSRQFHQIVRSGGLPEMFSNAINGAADGNFIPLPGGVLIFDRGEIIGAAGISGANSDLDEKIASQAIRATGLMTGQ